MPAPRLLSAASLLGRRLWRAVREVANAEKVLLIDLNAMSRDYYEKLGPEKSKSAFVDNTHTNGALEFVRFVAEALCRADATLAP